MFVFTMRGVVTFKSQLEVEEAGGEVEADLAGGWPGGREVAASSGRLPDVAEFRCCSWRRAEQQDCGGLVPLNDG